LSGTVTLPLNAFASEIKVRPIDDAAIEGSETVTLDLAPGPEYEFVSSAIDSVTIQDDEELPLVIV
jgi:hypothetical protein